MGNPYSWTLHPPHLRPSLPVTTWVRKMDDQLYKVMKTYKKTFENFDSQKFIWPLPFCSPTAEQHGMVVKVFKTLVWRVLIQFLREPKKLFPRLLAPLLHLTCGVGKVDDKDRSDRVTCDCLYTPTMGIMGEQWWTLNDIPRLNKKWKKKKTWCCYHQCSFFSGL